MYGNFAQFLHAPYHMIIPTLMLTIFFTLLRPILMFYRGGRDLQNKTISAVKLSFFLSLYPTLLFIDKGWESVTTMINCLETPNFNTCISFKFDAYSLLFATVAFYVTWAILEFAKWYMSTDPQYNRFFKYMLLFLIAMFVLVTASTLFQIFIGWEAVGIMSFLLIGWWSGRANANTAALQAIIYNRIGDIGLILALAWMAMHMNSWELHHLFAVSKNFDLTVPLLGLILAAMGKSAQFGLHPWLPSAMEGPTPVSALLHSSTMVVAGIFLLIRFSPLLENHPYAPTICLCLGAVTTLFTAACALTQNDIKKIVAFSTSSQLGLMMVTIGLNQPQLAFMHICTHAFFKAMLFLCSGSFIHTLNNEQDIRKMGNMTQISQMTATCLTIGSLALMGTPFLTGFFSKDTILEVMNTSYLNAWAMTLTLIATMFTAIYSIRIIYYALMNHPKFLPTLAAEENNPLLIKPLKRLAWGSIIAGWFISLSVVPYKPYTLSMPLTMKLSAFLLTVLGLLLALELAFMSSEQYKYISSINLFLFSILLGYYPLTMHFLTSKMSLTFAQNTAIQTIDQTWLEKVGPKMVETLNMPLISITDNFQQGVTKIYLCLFLITAMIMVAISYMT